MRRAYTLIIIGSLFTIWHFRIHDIDLLNSAVGYLLILLGLINVEAHRPISEFKQAKFFTVLLFLIEIIQPFSINISHIAIVFSILDLILPLFLYYFLVKSDYMWHPNPTTRNYLRRYVIFATTYLCISLLTFVAPQLFLIYTLVTAIYLTFLFYILLQLRQKSTV